MLYKGSNLKKIEAIIRPSKLEELKDALAHAGVAGMSVAEIRGHGRQLGHSELYRGAEYVVDFVPKMKVELIVADADVKRLVDVIVEATRTGNIGDGKIFISPVEKIIRIRTLEEDEEAI